MPGEAFGIVHVDPSSPSPMHQEVLGEESMVDEEEEEGEYDEEDDSEYIPVGSSRKRKHSRNRGKPSRHIRWADLEAMGPSDPVEEDMVEMQEDIDAISSAAPAHPEPLKYIFGIPEEGFKKYQPTTARFTKVPFWVMPRP